MSKGDGQIAAHILSGGTVDGFIMQKNAMEIPLKVHYMHEDLPLLGYAHDGDSGMDVTAFIPSGTAVWINATFQLHTNNDGVFHLDAGDRAVIPTGIRLGIPPGYEIQGRPKTGNAMKHGVMIVNTPGTIDQGYTGEIQVILYNSGKSPLRIQHGDRIAQIVLAPVARALPIACSVEDLGYTSRGEGRFGSTGGDIDARR